MSWGLFATRRAYASLAILSFCCSSSLTMPSARAWRAGDAKASIVSGENNTVLESGTAGWARMSLSSRSKSSCVSTSSSPPSMLGGSTTGTSGFTRHSGVSVSSTPPGVSNGFTKSCRGRSVPWPGVAALARSTSSCATRASSARAACAICASTCAASTARPSTFARNFICVAELIVARDRLAGRYFGSRVVEPSASSCSLVLFTLRGLIPTRRRLS